MVVVKVRVAEHHIAGKRKRLIGLFKTPATSIVVVVIGVRINVSLLVGRNYSLDLVGNWQQVIASESERIVEWNINSKYVLATR